MHMGFTVKSVFIYFVAVLLCAACSHPPVRATLDEVLADPGEYEGEELIITTTIKDVLEDYSLYRERRIEVTADLAYFGSRSFWTWYILLNDQGDELRCYTRHYRVSVGRDADVLMRRAASEKKPLTVNGVLRNDGIDIREIIYDAQIVRPDVKPPATPRAPGRYW
jgi:hypothetical protein